MKRTASAILLLLFLYNIVGCYLTFSVLNWQNRAQMSMAVIESNSLQTLRISRSELGNVIIRNGGKEITYQGEEYDVQQQVEDGDHVVFCCIKDTQEKDLLTCLSLNVHNNVSASSESGKKQNNISKVTTNDYLLNTRESALPRVYHDAIFNTANIPCITFVGSISSPPPKVSFS